jgi:hypothetical protein
MKADDFINESRDALYDSLAETRVAWGRTGKQGRIHGKTKLKFRCTTGPRAGRVVSDPSKCFAHPDVARSQRMKKTRARTKVSQARKAKRTKKLNIASKLARQLNKLLK